MDKLHITFDNIFEYKPSQLIGNVVHELDRAIELGWNINMTTWYTVDNIQCCTCCLGGAALLGLADCKQTTAELPSSTNGNQSLTFFCIPKHFETAAKVARLFDNIRCNYKSLVAESICSLYENLNNLQDRLNIYSTTMEWKGTGFKGLMTKEEIGMLKEEIISLSRLLEEANY